MSHTSDTLEKINIQNAIAKGEFEKAEALLQAYRLEGKPYDDIIAIMDASIGEYYKDRERVWEAIRNGLANNSRNYELYVMLGNYYLEENLHLSYLCYENALFYCDAPEDREAIAGLLFQLKLQYTIRLNRVSFVVLPHASLDFTKLCIESIRVTTPESAREIIVVDNGSKDGSVEWLREQKDIILVENREEVGFSAACNQGILASSKEADIFLINNDAMLTENALFWLRMGLYAQEDNGAAGGVSNTGLYEKIVDGIDNVPDLFNFGMRTNLPMRYPHEARIFLGNFALLVRRSVLDKVGLLDERFWLGYLADRDYGLRILKAGYRNVQCKNSFIIHFGREHALQGTVEYQETIQKEQELLDEKWGFHTQYYLGARPDLPQLIDEPAEKPLRILEIGCGCGALMGHLKSKYPNAKMYGIELIPEVAAVASGMGTVLCGNVEEMDFPWEDEWFDYIIMGDVLEHLMNPENVLRKFRRYLKADGHIIGSMPNVKHYSVIIPLLKINTFTYTDSGILDRTHVKMYTGTEIQRLVMKSGYAMEMLCSKTLGKPNEEEEKVIDLLVSLMEVPSKETYLTYQYIFRAGKNIDWQEKR